MTEFHLKRHEKTEPSGGLRLLWGFLLVSLWRMVIGTTQKLRAATPSLGGQAYAEFLQMVLCDIWAYQNMAGEGPAIRPLWLSFEATTKKGSPNEERYCFCARCSRVCPCIAHSLTCSRLFLFSQSTSTEQLLTCLALMLSLYSMIERESKPAHAGC